MRFEDLATGPAPQIPLEAFDARRRRAAEALGPGRALIVATHAPVPHSNDVEYRFRPQSDFWYLTGFNEPHAALVIIGGTAESHLFLRERKPEAEIWNGRRLGVERARDALDVDHAYSIKELAPRLGGLMAGLEAVAIDDHNPEMAEIIHNAIGDTLDGSAIVAGLRSIKDDAEIAMLQRANDIGIEAMRAAIGRIKPGAHEYELEAALLETYRSSGSTGPSYPPIVGSGDNAAILHYIDNTARLESDELVLIDAGCEWGYYASDITRTIPTSGWTSLQLDLYNLVLEAQDAAIQEVRPGNPFRAPHDAAVRTLATGLVDRGYLKGDVDAVIKDETYRSFYMHGTSHLLGLDVHDVGSVKDPDGESRLLEPGMVLTVEPGLYFNPDFATVPAGLPTMGLRIENDIVVTSDGCLDLTRDMERDPDDLLALVR